MLEHFYCNAGILNYTFGPQHPLKPERLHRTLALLKGLTEVDIIDHTAASETDLLRVHDEEYVASVREIDRELGQIDTILSKRKDYDFGFGGYDNPPFSGMYDAALAYVGSTAAAARAVRNGSRRAYAIGGGLHHAQRRKASGFCIFNDAAIACHILREQFDRVAYVDIDVHHGDGVQWIFYDDPSVLTCSIHESGRTLYPGTGYVDEVGSEFSAVNVPVVARTSGRAWLGAFELGILPALENWEPEALVLQLGTDTHRDDPLGHVRSTQQDWLSAVRRLHEFDLPTVVLGGGGYNLSTVPRMWVSAILTLGNIPFDNKIPSYLGEIAGSFTFSDEMASWRSDEVEQMDQSAIEWLRKNHRLFEK